MSSFLSQSCPTAHGQQRISPVCLVNTLMHYLLGKVELGIPDVVLH